MSAPADERVLAVAPRLDFDRIRADVEALAAMERGSAAAQQPQVAWLEARLRDSGAHEVRTESFRFQRRWIWRHGAHALAGLGAAVAGGLAGAGLAVAALASLEMELSGRSRWTSRFLPAGEGANVVARIPAAGLAARTVVFVAHHDAARTGLLWRLPRTTKPLGLGAQLALALVTLGCLAGSRIVRAAGAAVLGALTLLGLDVARSQIVPGANDNATGIGALLALTAAFARDPLERTDVIALFTDCEEVGLGGIEAWLETHGDSLDRAGTLVVSLDTLGSGEPALVKRDGALSATYASENHDWADRGATARRGGAAPPRRPDRGNRRDRRPSRGLARAVARVGGPGRHAGAALPPADRHTRQRRLALGRAVHALGGRNRPRLGRGELARFRGNTALMQHGNVPNCGRIAKDLSH